MGDFALAWFADFRKNVVGSGARSKWPGNDESFWTYLHDALQALKTTEEEANTALAELTRKGGCVLSKVIGSFEDLVRAQRYKTDVAARGVIAASREKAVEMSTDCPECGGGVGLTTRRFYLPAKQATYSIGFFCGCPHGRWLAEADRKNRALKQLPRTIPDLADWGGLWNPTIEYPLNWAERSNLKVPIEFTVWGEAQFFAADNFLVPGERAPAASRPKVLSMRGGPEPKSDPAPASPVIMRSPELQAKSLASCLTPHAKAYLQNMSIPEAIAWTKRYRTEGGEIVVPALEAAALAAPARVRPIEENPDAEPA